MSHFVDSEAEESEHEGMDDEEEEMGQLNRKVKKDKRKKQIDSDDDDDDEEDDDDGVVNDLIDDNPIEEDEDSDNESDGSRKRKKSDDEEELDDRLEDEDYALLEENLGVKIQRKRFKKIRRMDDEESDEDEGTQDRGDDREAIANQLFEGSDNEEEGTHPRSSVRREEPMEQYASEESEGEYSETDDFIVDDEGRPITDRRKKRKPIYTDAALQEAQDIFGVDFDYADLERDEEEDYDEEEEEDEDEYENEEQISARRGKKDVRRKRKMKTLHELYEPHELERAGITEEDDKIRKMDIPERFQLRSVPVTTAGEDELEEEAEWIFKIGFINKKFDVEKPKPAAAAAGTAEDWETRSQVSKIGSTVGGPAAAEEEDWEKQSQMSARTAVSTTKPAQDGEEDWEQQSVVSQRTVGERSVVGEKTVVADKSVIDVQLDVKPIVVAKIKTALDLMRNEQSEVPFIAFYRKEYVLPELKINDLWKIYRLDARFCQLKQRKQRLAALFKNMQDYQTDMMIESSESGLPDNIRLITDDDIDRIRAIQRSEELKDMNLLFSLYYSEDVPAMKDRLVRKRKEERQRLREEREKEKALLQPNENGEEPEEPMDIVPEEPEENNQIMKRKTGGGAYSLCKKFGVEGLVKKFGLTPDKFAENLRDNYQRNEVEQYPATPLVTSSEHLNDKLKNPEEALRAAKFMLATQISREPTVRSSVRETFFERATITVTPTKKGLREIDEAHPCYSMRYLKSKPVRELKKDEFLKLVIAEDDKLLNIVLGDTINGITSENYVDEVKELFRKDDHDQITQEWNEVRCDLVEFAMEKILYPVFRKELKAKLLEEAREHIMEIAMKELNKQLIIAPFKVSYENVDADDWDSTRGIRVLAIAYVPDITQSSFAAVLSPDGEPVEHLRLEHITKSMRSFNEDDKTAKLKDLKRLKGLIRDRRPHVIVIGGESREALMIRDDVLGIITELKEDEDEFPDLKVEIIDNELSKVYSNSLKGQSDFRDYPLVLREAVSLGRRVQDPLIEFAQLVNHDDEILCLRFHPLQDQVPKEELLEALITQFVNWTNEVGVDLNRCISSPHTASIAQFICGLGPRKSTALIKTLKQNNQRLENRTQLITFCHMGPKIFINCSGFIKIDTVSLGDSTESYIEVLDGSRVHPETYEWARKMAVDALEEDEENGSALEDILNTPEKLEELNLDAFADELKRQGFGNKRTTLYDIRDELNCRYKEKRSEYKTPNVEELFHMLTKETEDTLYPGKLTTATVIGVSHKKPQGDQLDNAIPVKNEQTGMWQCSFCMKNDFPDLSEVWNHFDAGSCPGQATGIRVRLENGINGFIPIQKLSDKSVSNPDERVKRGQTIHCRITKVDPERFQVDCTSRTSDLVDAKHELKPTKDPYYDQEQEEKDKKREDDLKNKKRRQTYVRRVIVHPSFKNVSFKELIPMMDQMDQGEVIIRPSSKGTDHLTVSWKVTDGVYQHVDVKEHKKENMFSLGKTLFIGTEEFEDLDEIIARYINPLASFARDLVNYKYYTASLGGSKAKAEEYLREEKSKNPNKIHYVFHASKEFPGKFVLSYLPSSKIHHEFITINASGFRYRQQNFSSVNNLLKWFKEHYRDPPPTINTPVTATPKTNMARTPFATTPGPHDGKILPPPPSHFSAHPAASHTTPHYTTPAQGFTPYSSFTTHTPYTPTAQTPYITPYQTPYQSGGTPRSSGANGPNPQSGVFLHPGATGYRSTGQKPGQGGGAGAPGGRSRPGSTSQQQTDDNSDWRKAAEAWAKSQQRPAGWGTRPPRPAGGGSGGNRQGQGQSHTHRGPQPGPGSVSHSFGMQMSRGQDITAQAVKSIQQFGHLMAANNSSSAHNFIPSRSPRSGRDSLKSTPRTNFSPRSMVESSLGDETPLHDEN